MRRFLTILCAGLVTACGSTAARDPSALALNLTLQRSDASSVIIRVTFTNNSVAPVAVSRTHGYGSTWLRLQVLDEENRPVRYPDSVPEFVLQSPPRHECLRPGESLTWDIDLLRWALEYGGERRVGEHQFSLRTDSAYNVTAFYVDVPGGSHKCPSIDGEARSNTITVPRRIEPIH